MNSQIIYKFLITIGLVLVNSVSVFSQVGIEGEANADQYMLEKQFEIASELYANILKKDSTNELIIYKYANSLRLQQNYSAAYYFYSQIIETDFVKEESDLYFYYAQTAQYLNKFSEAIENYNNYINKGKSNSLRSQSEQYIKACKFSISHQNDSLEVEVIHLEKPINTSYSEFNPVLISNNELVFSRYQPVFHDSIENVFNQSYYADIFLSKQTLQGWQKATLFSQQLSSNKYFSANICFSKNLQTAYFTRCYDQEGEIGQCAIYMSQKRGNRWTKPKKLNSKVNVRNFSSSHPYLAEFEDYSILYFISNQPNGFGENDIWYALIKDDHIDQVKNMGSIINSKGNEYTPFYDVNQGILFFSSDKPSGLGGFDIYKSIGGLSSWQAPANLGSPINSASNDLYYSQYREGTIAYLSSNRFGSYYHGNEENCCSDIYLVLRHKIETNELPIDTPAIVLVDSNVVAIRKLLPLSLYFENDMPNPKSIQTTTTSNYKDLLVSYIEAKDIYKNEYSKGLDTEQSAAAQQHIEDFFDTQVSQGFENLELFAQLLKRELVAGKTVRIKIRGYASPLNSTEYNLALSKRRIASLKNFIAEYEDGYFSPYLSTHSESKGKLLIFEDPLGDSQSIGLVSDNPNDKRNSIYSREAALQRKIQIIMYSSDDQSLDSAQYPILKWQNSAVLMSDVKKGENKSIVVLLENVGQAELQIQNIVADCKCLQIQMDKAVFQINEQGKFYILLRTSNLDLGNHQIKLTLQTNEIQQYRTYDVHFRVIE